jgi:hypothetical protein
MERKILNKIGVFFTDPQVTTRYDHHDLARFISNLSKQIDNNS